MIALASVDSNETSLVSLRETFAADKSQLEKWLTTCTQKFANDALRIHKLDRTRDTLYEFATKVDETVTKLRSFEDYNYFLEDQMLEKSKQPL